VISASGSPVTAIKIGELAGLERAEPILHAEKLGCHGRRGADRVHRRHAAFYHELELARVVAVWPDTTIGAENDFHTGPVARAKVPWICGPIAAALG
jgi:hypothetical protein